MKVLKNYCDICYRSNNRGSFTCREICKRKTVNGVRFGRPTLWKPAIPDVDLMLEGWTIPLPRMEDVLRRKRGTIVIDDPLGKSIHIKKEPF